MQKRAAFQSPIKSGLAFKSLLRQGGMRDTGNFDAREALTFPGRWRMSGRNLHIIPTMFRGCVFN